MVKVLLLEQKNLYHNVKVLLECSANLVLPDHVHVSVTVCFSVLILFTPKTTTSDINDIEKLARVGVRMWLPSILDYCIESIVTDVYAGENYCSNV